MKLLCAAGLLLFVPGMLLAQTSTEKPDTQTQQTDVTAEIKALKEAMAQQQQQMAVQQHEIETLRQQLAGRQPAQPESVSAGSVTPVVAAKPVLTNVAINTADSTGAAAPAGSAQARSETEHKDSPLSFRIGGADFTPGGFMDFTSIFRTTNSGNAGGTNFFAIPFSNQVAGHLTEERLTAANSRFSLKVHDSFGATDVTAYTELDFLGNDAATVEVTSNSHTIRERLYFVDVKHGKWEVAAGQMWSWLTPNRVGMSSYTPEVFYSSDMDFNYQVGLTWTRAPQIRFAYHPNENWGFGVALENPEQFVGQGGEVTFPSAFNATLGTQLDAANQSSTPNAFPDIIPKIAYDTTVNGKHFHAEAAGLISTFKITNLFAGNFVKHSAVGGGISGAVNLELFKNFRFVSNFFVSDGGGRYIFGSGPDLVVLPNAAGTDLRISTVRSYAGIAGFEWQFNPENMFYSYYGGDYFGRNFAVDTTSIASVQPFVGFGYPSSTTPARGGSANSNNRSLQEPSLGWVRTFWKNPQHGALQVITQGSYLTRSPWFVAAGAPKNAHLFMIWADLRYVLP